jgi:hypothetical protein
MAQKQANASPQNQITEEILLKREIAKKALEDLTELGVDKEKFLTLLSRIPLAPKQRVPLVEGMADARVRALPDRIRSWADAIERVNASPFLRPRFLPEHIAEDRAPNPEVYPEPLDKILTPEMAEPTAKLFESLPGSLRLYADCLQAQLQFFHPTGPRRRKFGYQPIRLRVLFTLQLLRLVRKSAGRPCLPQVATLLNRAFEVVGEPTTISEDNLEKLEENNRWLVWLVSGDGL